MGLIFSRRVGTDPYYANYEKSFDRLEKECLLLGTRRERRKLKTRSCRNTFNLLVFALTVLAVAYVAWVQRLPKGRLSLRQHLTSTLLAVAAPLLAVLVRAAVLFLLRWAETRDEALLKKLHNNKRKMIKELKDSTRFEKTMALIKKFDPDAAPTPAPPLPGTPGSMMPGTAGTARRGMQQRDANGQMLTPAPNQGGGVGFGTPLAAAGRALFPVFDRLASNMIGDNPMLLEDLRRAQSLTVSLQQQNDELRRKLAHLEGRPSDTGDGGAPGGVLLLEAPQMLFPSESGNSSTFGGADRGPRTLVEEDSLGTGEEEPTHS